MNISLQKIINKIEKYSFRKRVLCFSFFCIIIGVGYFYLYFQPAYNQIKKLKGEISQLNKQIQSKRIVLLKLPKIKKELEEKQIIFSYAKKLLPDTRVEVENILANIEALGNEVGVEFLLFQPKGKKITNFYAIRYVDLKIKGYFPNLMMFFAHISNLNRLVTLKTLTLSPTGKNFLLTADCTLAIYRALTPEEMNKIQKEKRRKKRKKK